MERLNSDDSTAIYRGLRPLLRSFTAPERTYFTAMPLRLNLLQQGLLAQYRISRLGIAGCPFGRRGGGCGRGVLGASSV